jgi:hypothetical protein
MVMMKILRRRRMEVIFLVMKGTGGRCFCCVRCLGQHPWWGQGGYHLGSEDGTDILEPA